MTIETNIQTVKDFFAPVSRGDREALLALVTEDLEWIIPGEDWPLAGTRHGHAGLVDLLETASRSVETSTEPREFVAHGDRVLVLGFASGRIKVTNKTFKDDWVSAITIRDGKLAGIREYVDTQAMARASQLPRALNRALNFESRVPGGHGGRLINLLKLLVKFSRAE